MSTTYPLNQKPRPWWMETALVDFRHAFLPWIVYLLAVVTYMYSLFLDREIWVHTYTWTIPLWHISAVAIVIQILCSDYSDSTTETLLSAPVHRTRFWLLRMATGIVMLAFPFLVMAFAPFIYYTSDINYAGMAYKVAAFQVLHSCLISIDLLLLGSLLATLFQEKRFVFIILLTWPILLIELTTASIPSPSARFPNILLGNPIAGLIIGVPAAIVAWRMWLNQQTVRSRPSGKAFSRNSYICPTGINRELVTKELHLQKSNIVFAVVVALLGIIGLLSVKAADPSVGSFSPADIRAGIFACMVVPVLIIILPIMIGSTAAAAEKPMEVWRWQAALPLSWRHTILMKVAVASVITVFVAGILPYLVQLGVPDEQPLRMLFRETWPGWVALLCAAAGFYGGSIARDDYQGLLISIVPLTVILFVTLIADPMRLVFPAIGGIQQPITKEWALASRLLLISAALVYCGSHLLKRASQKWAASAVKHAVAISIAAFVLTLINVHSDRSLLATNTMSQFQSGWNSEIFPGEKFVPARFLAGIDLTSDDIKSVYINFNSGIDAGRPANSGTIDTKYRAPWERKSVDHHFTIDNFHVHEFPQSATGNLSGASSGGAWILVDLGKGRQLICGPACLAIDSWYMPRTTFVWLTQVIGIQEFPSLPRMPLLNGIPVDALFATNWNCTLDSERHQYVFRQVSPRASNLNELTKTGLEWKIPVYQPGDDGTTVTISFRRTNQIQQLRLNGIDYAQGGYLKKGPISIGNRLVAQNAQIETGACFINLTTGKQTLVPLSLPISSRVVSELQNAFESGKRASVNWYDYSDHISHSSGALAGWRLEDISIIDPVRGEWQKGALRYKSHITNPVQDAVFLDSKRLAVTNGIAIWIVDFGTPPSVGRAHYPREI